MKPTASTRLPNLVIIGAMKAGTTSLHYYLNQHPEISMSRQKELNFYTKNWKKGINWYVSQFSSIRGNAKVYGESSPSYTYYPAVSGVPERMHSVIPDAKLIYVVRDPLERIISHYIHWYQGPDSPTLVQVLADFESSQYVHCSKYHMQIAQYLPFYPPSKILLITQDELFSRRVETLKKIFKFLNVDESFESPQFSKIRHKSSDKRHLSKTGTMLTQLIDFTRLGRLSPDLAWHLKRFLILPFSRPITKPVLDRKLELKLIAHLRTDMEQLTKFTGRDFTEWACNSR